MDAVAEFGDRDRIGLQLVERGLRLGSRHARGDGVLEADRMGDDLLALCGNQISEELLGVGLVSARLQYARRGDVQYIARVAGSEIG